MLGRYRNSYAEVNLKTLEHNFLHLQKMVASSSLIPMVKANAYGHGEVHVSRVFEKLGARSLGVALIEEGIRLREAGLQLPILFFGFFDAIGAEALVKYRLTPVLSSFDQIEKLKASLSETDSFPVHLEFNTGMQRNGFEVEEADILAEEFQIEAQFKLEGLCTHFISSDDYSDPQGRSRKQEAIFQKIRNLFKTKAQKNLVSHISNSGGLFSGLRSGYEAFRPGLSVYGVGVQREIEMSPVLSLKSQIVHIRKVKANSTVSYGGTWKAPQDSIIAVIPLGYADGVPRGLSNKGHVLIQGQRCAIRGVICMDYFMVDVSTLKQVIVGDEVVLLGSQKEEKILAEEWAMHLGTISYEILTGIQERVPRIYTH